MSETLSPLHLSSGPAHIHKVLDPWAASGGRSPGAGRSRSEEPALPWGWRRAAHAAQAESRRVAQSLRCPGHSPEISVLRGHSARVAWALLRNAGSTSEVLHQDPLSNTLSMLQRPPVKPRPPVEQEAYSPWVPCFHTQSGLRHVVLEECHPQTPSDPSHLGPVQGGSGHSGLGS